MTAELPAVPAPEDPRPFEGASGIGEMATMPFAGTITVPVAVIMPAAPNAWDTVTFPAIRDDDGACRCGMCPGSNPDERGALLSCGPGVVSRMWRERIRNGQWENIRAAVREGRKRVHEAALASLDGIHDNLDCDWHDIAAAFRADTALLTDPALAQGLAAFEAELAAKADEMRRWVAERAEALRNEAETGAA